MKKSNKKKSPNPEEIIKDTNKILDIINELDNINIEKLNIKEFEEKINSIEKELKEKYKDLDIPK